MLGLASLPPLSLTLFLPSNLSENAHNHCSAGTNTPTALSHATLLFRTEDSIGISLTQRICCTTNCKNATQGLSPAPGCIGKQLWMSSWEPSTNQPTSTATSMKGIVCNTFPTRVFVCVFQGLMSLLKLKGHTYSHEANKTCWGTTSCPSCM